MKALDEPVNEQYSLFTNRAISGATYLGGPLAAGILMYINFKNLGNKEAANKSLALGISVSLVLVFIVIMISNQVLESVPRAVFPLFYTALVYWLVEKYLGKELEEHTAQNRPFYSWMRAALISLLSAIVFLGSVFGAALIPETDVESMAYDRGIEQFSKNETEALKLFDMMNSSSDQEIIGFIRQIGIPLWMENLQLIRDLDKLEGLDEEFQTQNDKLLLYCQLRVRSYNLIIKSLNGLSNDHFEEFEEVNGQIDDLLKTL
jgi:hypothetical protein